MVFLNFFFYIMQVIFWSMGVDGGCMIMCVQYEEFTSLLAVAPLNMFSLPLLFSQAEEKHAKQFMNITTVKSPECMGKKHKVLTLIIAALQKVQTRFMV